MTIQVNPVDATLGAEIDVVDLRRLDDATFRDIESAFHEYGVLILHEQHLTTEEQVAFARRFGSLELADERGIRPELAGQPMIIEISNVDEHGAHITDPRHPQVQYLGGNEGWHSDSSFKPVTAKASVLCCIAAATTGGQTGFADMRAAYDALGDAERKALEGLEAWHSLEYSQAVAGAVDAQVPSDPRSARGALHPIVRRHAVTGRPSLFIGRHACHIDGLDSAEGQALLDRLLADACRPPRIYMHQWRDGDVVVWDNRCVLHRVTVWDLRERRVMRHVRVGGDRAHEPVGSDSARQPA